MKKKSIRIVVTLALITLVALGIWQYFKKGIELEKITADLHFVGQDQLKIDMDIQIDTRFFWETKIYGVSYQLKLADKVILDGAQNFDTLIIDNKRTTIPLELTLNPKEIRSTIDSLQVTDSTYLELEYQVDYHLPILGKKRTHNKNLKKIKVPIPPEIKLEELKVQQMKLTEPLVLLARVKVVNHSDLALSIKDLKYEMIIEENEWASGNVDEPINVEGKSENIIDLPIKVSPKKVGKRLWQRFIKGDSIHYSIKANGKLNLNVKKLSLQNIDFELDGVY